MSVQLHWKRVIFSDETQVVVGHDRRVHAWRKADEIGDLNVLVWWVAV